jgi:tyrosinase
MAKESIRERKSLIVLEKEYKNATEKPNTELIKLMKAWKAISNLPGSDPNSFHYIATHHGAPFRGAGYKDPYYWGGYCHHGNILFPLWHRLYVLALENALRSVKGYEDVTLPYWDETAEVDVSIPERDYVPWSLTQKRIILFDDGDAPDQPNPLYSYKFVQGVIDSTTDIRPGSAPYSYTKKVGYQTVRFPLSGLMGTDEAERSSLIHNDLYEGRENELLNMNINHWLNKPIGDTGRGIIHKHVLQCLCNPDYLTFSNNTSRSEWNATQGVGVVSLERPHNDMHLALGGFNLIQDVVQGLPKPVLGSNGDMAVNETASYDPIFYFHHAFIDYVFWVWQQRHNLTSRAAAILYQQHLNKPEYRYYPGTNSSDEQGATISIQPNTRLTLNTHLEPFLKKTEQETPSYYEGLDCFDYTAIPAPPTVEATTISINYQGGSLEGYRGNPIPEPFRLRRSTRTLEVSGINRGLIHGSYIVSVFNLVQGKNGNVQEELIDLESVLSRWQVQGCVNCQTHLTTNLSFDISDVNERSIQVKVNTHDSQNPSGVASQTSAPGFQNFSTKLHQW